MKASRLQSRSLEGLMHADDHLAPRCRLVQTSKESGVGRRDESSRFAVEVVLPSPLFTSTFGLVVWGFFPCQHITDGSIALGGSPCPVKQCRESRWSPSSPPPIPRTVNSMDSPFSNLRTLTLNPCRRRMPWRTPQFRKRNPKCPLQGLRLRCCS
jgi:hypothetical protein